MMTMSTFEEWASVEQRLEPCRDLKASVTKGPKRYRPLFVAALLVGMMVRANTLAGHRQYGSNLSATSPQTGTPSHFGARGRAFRCGRLQGCKRNGNGFSCVFDPRAFCSASVSPRNVVRALRAGLLRVPLRSIPSGQALRIPLASASLRAPLAKKQQKIARFDPFTQPLNPLSTDRKRRNRVIRPRRRME